MKKIIFIFLTSSLFSIAQTSAPVIKISSIKLRTQNSLWTVRDIVPELTGCNISSCRLGFSVRGNIKQFVLSKDSLTGEVRTILAGFKAGQKFLIEDIKSDCDGKKVFTIKVI